MKHFVILSCLTLIGCLGVNSGNPLKRETASVAPVATKATVSAVCTRCIGLTQEDLEELRWMLEEMPPVPDSYEYEQY